MPTVIGRYVGNVLIFWDVYGNPNVSEHVFVLYVLRKITGATDICKGALQ
jgi:hypothetical protein